MAVSTPPPHDLQLVIDFVNTLDVDEGTEALGTTAGLGDWLRDRGLYAESSSDPTDSELAEAIELREALRAVLLAHNQGEHDPKATATLERAADRGRLSVRFSGDGSVGLEPRASDFWGALARVLVPVAEAAADGTWMRVKACDADDCVWAFYDRSRNRSGRWCDMAVCGNRTKVRTYRTKGSGEG
ncbi:MAG: CGNR zinc finger domain-containing protein [Solirubrobacteraceae bacterium]